MSAPLDQFLAFPGRRHKKPSYVKSLYNRNEMEKNIFWDAYCEIERVRTEEMQEQARKDYSALQELNSTLRASKNRHGSSSLLSSSSSKKSKNYAKPKHNSMTNLGPLSSNNSMSMSMSWMNESQRHNYNRLSFRIRVKKFWSGYFSRLIFFVRSFMHIFRDRDMFDNEGLLELPTGEMKEQWREKRKKQYLDEREFRLFFIERTKTATITILAFSIFTVTVITIMITESLLKNESLESNISAFALTAMCIIWIFICCMCLWYIVHFVYFRSSDTNHDRNLWYERWVNLGRCILYARVFIVSNNIFRYLTNSDKCYAYFDGRVTTEQMFHSYIIVISLDLFHTIVLSLMPFPWPWAIYFNCVLFVEEALRIYTCKQLLFGGDGFTDLINTVVVNMAIVLIIVGISTSYSFERCVRSSYKNIQDQNASAQEKMMLVNMLCRDVKAPTQTFVQIFQSMEAVLSRTPIELKTYTQSLQGITKVVNLIVDDILFLVRVEERRFDFHCSSKIHIPTMLSSIYDALKIATLQGNDEIIGDDTFETSWFDETLTTEKNCLRVLLYYSLLAAVELATLQLSKTSQQTPLDNKNLPIVSRAPPNSIFIKFERLPVSRTCFSQSNRIQSELGLGSGMYMCKITIFVTDPARSFAMMGLAKKSLLEAVCVICQRIVDTYGGSCGLFSNRIEFTLLCQENSAPNDEDDEPVEYRPIIDSIKTNSDAAPSIRRNSFFLPEKLMQASKSFLGKDTPVIHHGDSSSSSSSSSDLGNTSSVSFDIIESHMTRYIPKNVYIYNSDPALVGLLRDIVENIPGGADLMFHTQLSAAQLKIHSVAFTQSVTACIEVKEKGFQGKIVLLSERLTYLDESERRHYDFGVSLPCNQDDIQSLIRWLYIRSLKESISEQQNQQPEVDTQLVALEIDVNSSYSTMFRVEVSNIFSSLFSRVIKTLSSSKDTNQKKEMKFGGRSRSRIRSMFQMLIPSNRMDSYGQWRLMNPSFSWFHHTNQFQVFALLVTCMGVFSWVFGIISMRFFAPFFMYFLSLAIRKTFYNTIVRRTTISFTAWWWLCSVYDITFLFVSFVGDFFETKLKNGRFSIEAISYAPDNINSLTFAQFLDAKRGSLRGSELMFILVYFPGWLKLTGEFVISPLNYCADVTYSIRAFLLMTRIVKMFLTPAMLRYMIWLIFSLVSVISTIKFLNERLYREEFSELYDLIKSKDFLEKCLQVSRKGLFIPMKKLNTTYNDLMKDIIRCAIEDSFFIGHELLSKFEQMKINVLLSKELSYSLRVADGKFFRRPIAVVFNAMHDVYIRDVVHNVSSSFMLSHGGMGLIHKNNEINCTIADLSLSIFFHLHPSLTMVKVDEELLTALLCNGCRTAIERIQQTIQSDPKYQAYAHQILIWVAPSRFTDVVKFTEVRVLEVYILDTGLLMPREQNSDVLQGFEVIVPNFNMLNGESSLETCKSEPLFHHIGISNKEIPTVSANNHTKLRSTLSVKDAAKVVRCTGGQAICDKYMKFFMLPLRFQTGLVKHKQFQSFQRFGVPYMMCRDGNKYDQWFTSDQSMTVINHSKKLQFYEKYLNSYGENLENVLSQARKIYKETGLFKRSLNFGARPHRNPTVTSSNSRRRRRKFEGVVSIFSKLGGDLSQAVIENKRIFNQLGWKCRMTPLKDLPNIASLGDVDCIIMESDITTRAWSYDFRDLIHYLRANGFQGVIIVAVTKNSQGPSSANPQFAPGQSIWKPNAAVNQAGATFRDALATEIPDMFLAVPFGSNEVKNIVKSIEQRIMSLFIAPS